MTKTNIRTVAMLGLLAAVLCSVILLRMPARATAIAPGCTSARPTAITGSIWAFGGAYNNWTVNVMVGIDLLDSLAHKVNPDGSPAGGGYSYVDKPNQTMAPPGAASGPDRTFGADQADGNGVLCVAANVKTVWIELYPKNQLGFTDKTYYGGANDQRLPVTAGVTNRYGLRLPTAHAYGGNTGDVNGYVTYQGHSVTPADLQFRVFPTSPGTACGVQGFSAGADGVGLSSSRNATYYLIKNIAGGQCGAASQQYKVSVTCSNGGCGSTKSQTLLVNVANGARPRLDFKF